jgi:outer membrane lipoprotein SlyB
MSAWCVAADAHSLAPEPLMRHSRVLLIPVLVLGAACAEQGTSAEDPLGRDLLLATQVHTDAVERELSALGGAGVCSAPADHASPTVAQQAQAERVLRRAQEAALMGEQRRAHQLYREAAQIDGSSATIAYHLARSSDALDDHAAAVDAYCRFLTLAPGTQQAADVRGRLAALAGGEAQPDSQAPRPAARVVSTGAVHRPAARVASARRSSSVRATGGRAPARRSTAATQPAAGGEVRTQSSAGSVESEPVREEPMTPQSAESRETASAATRPSAPATTARAGRDNTMRGAVIGAAAGAIVGAAVGRDVKSGVVGAAAGGLIGAVVGRTTSRGQALRGGTFRTPTWSPR